MKLQAIWLTSAFQSRLHKVVNSCVPRRPEFLWSRVLGPLQASAASLSMDRVHGTVYPQPYVHRTFHCAHSSASWNPTCSLTDGVRCPNNRPAPLWLYSEFGSADLPTYLPPRDKSLRPFWWQLSQIKFLPLSINSVISPQNRYDYLVISAVTSLHSTDSSS